MKTNFEELRMSIHIIQFSMCHSKEYVPFLHYIREKLISKREEYDTS